MLRYALAVLLLPFTLIAGPDMKLQWSKDTLIEPSKNGIEEMQQHISLSPHSKILDIGCGTGKDAFQLAQIASLGSVHGIDTSPILIDTAKKTFFRENLSFETLNVLDLDEENGYDLITSFATLHWVDDQETLLFNISKALKPRGIFYFQMPWEMPPAMNEALSSTLSKASWAPYFENFTCMLSSFNIDEYMNKLHAAGLEFQSINARITPNIFETKRDFMLFLVHWLPHLSRLPMGKKMAFLNEVVAQYLSIVPQDKNDAVFFPIKRLTVVGKKAE